MCTGPLRGILTSVYYRVSHIRFDVFFLVFKFSLLTGFIIVYIFITVYILLMLSGQEFMFNLVYFSLAKCSPE